MTSIVLGLCIDVSVTLGGVGEEELNLGLAQLFERLGNHPRASEIHLALVTFDHRGAAVTQKLAPLATGTDGAPRRAPKIHIAAPDGQEIIPDLFAAVDLLLAALKPMPPAADQFLAVLPISHNVLPMADRTDA